MAEYPKAQAYQPPTVPEGQIVQGYQAVPQNITTVVQIESTGDKVCRKCKKRFTDPQLVPHTSCCCCVLGTLFGVTLLGLIFCCCCKTQVSSCPNCGHAFDPGWWWC